MTLTIPLVLSLAAGTGPIVAQDTAPMHGMDHGTMAPGTVEMAIDDAMDQMMSDMHGVEPTGDPDADFLLMMIPHHRSAVDMAEAVMPEIDDPEVVALARAIIASQEAEILAMQAMLERLGHATAGDNR